MQSEASLCFQLQGGILFWCQIFSTHGTCWIPSCCIQLFGGTALWVPSFWGLQSVLDSRQLPLISLLQPCTSSRCHFSVSFTFPFQWWIFDSSKCLLFGFTKVALDASSGICPRQSFWGHKDRRVGLKKKTEWTLQAKIEIPISILLYQDHWNE